MRAEAILVGDIGGTNVRFAIAHAAPSADGLAVEISDVWTAPGDRFAVFEDALAAFLSTASARPTGASFGLAGAVVEGRVELLHRKWTVDARHVAATLDVPRVRLANDFEAMARSAPELGVQERADLHLPPGFDEAASRNGAQVVAGPGTGLGLGALVRRQNRWTVVGGEGGHQAYAPQSPPECELLKALQKRGHYVSFELVASGSGFEATSVALADVLGVVAPNWDAAASVRAAKAGDDFALELCRLRARATMTFLGNGALAFAARGAWLAGGVSLALDQWLREPAALARFYDRGPRTELMAAIPIRVINAPFAALAGAAWLYLDDVHPGGSPT